MLAPFMLGLLSPAGAEEAGTTARTTPLKADARAESATLTTLPSGTSLSVLTRTNGWARVQTPDKKAGWVNVFHLRMQATSNAESSSGGLFSSLSSLLSPKREANKTIATVGIRGLSEEDMKNAKPNPAELSKLKSFAMSKADAEAAARRARLSATTVAYVDENGKPLAGGAR